VIEVKGLSKRYGSTVAVDGLTFRAEPGRVTAFLGPNGAGKTTTLRVVLGLVRATAGAATILGRAYADLDEPARQVGAVLETSSFHPGRSGRSELRILATAAGIAGDRVSDVLGLVGLGGVARRRTKTYSLGMRQRLGVAAALLGDPDVLVLDEPANGLDPEGIRWLRDLLRSLADGGRTVLLSSHVLAEVAQLADDVVIIHRGRYVTSGTVAEVTARAGGSVRVRTPARDALRGALAAAGLQPTPGDDDALVVPDASTARVGEIAAANGVVLHELVAESSSLEEAFLELVSAEGRGEG
jgi:ABC-2 type transport system ATP-binding protein